MMDCLHPIPRLVKRTDAHGRRTAATTEHVPRFPRRPGAAIPMGGMQQSTAFYLIMAQKHEGISMKMRDYTDGIVGYEVWSPYTNRIRRVR